MELAWGWGAPCSFSLASVPARERVRGFWAQLMFSEEDLE